MNQEVSSNKGIGILYRFWRTYTNRVLSTSSQGRLVQYHPDYGYLMMTISIDKIAVLVRSGIVVVAVISTVLVVVISTLTLKQDVVCC